MYKIGLTGGIGSGKSLVASLLEQWGASVVDTDLIAHELTAPGGDAIEPIRQAFGPDVITAEGALNRAVMRERVFAEPALRKQLEGILHPQIARATERRAAQATGCYIVFVVPLLVESGRWRNRLDRICVVDCDPDTQVQRVQQRSGLTPEAIGRIMQAQATREQRLAQADDVILNTEGTTPDDISRQAQVLHRQWCQAAKQAGSPT